MGAMGGAAAGMGLLSLGQSNGNGNGTLSSAALNMSAEGRFGLAGLLDVIRMTDKVQHCVMALILDVWFIHPVARSTSYKSSLPRLHPTTFCRNKTHTKTLSYPLLYRSPRLHSLSFTSHALPPLPPILLPFPHSPPLNHSPAGFEHSSSWIRSHYFRTELKFS
jgi:hypothetical protein